MKKIGLISVFVLCLACDNDKITEVFNQSQFYNLRVDPQAVTLPQGGSQQLAVTAYDASCTGTSCDPLAPGTPVAVAGTPIWVSTDTTVATVSATGLVTAKAKAGTTNIIGTVQDIPGAVTVPSVTRADTTPVTVLAATATLPAVNSITLTASRSTAGVGSTDTLTVNYLDAAGATVATQRAATNASGLGRPAFFSSDPSVATVNATGIVTGVKPGSATITATNTLGGNTRSATFPITITDPVAGTFFITTATTGNGIIFFPDTLTVSATEAAIEGRPNATTPGAVVTWTVVGSTNFPTTFTSTTTPNNTQCFNVTFTDPTVAKAAPAAPQGSTVPAGNSGNIGTGAIGSTNPPICTAPTGNNAAGKDAQSRLFTTPGTYTFTSTTNGDTATLIVK